MLRKKTGQLHTQVQSPESPELAKAAVDSIRSQLRRKGLTALTTLLLLVSLVIAGTMAWYTRVSNVTGMTMDVAKFDFNANYTGADEVFVIDVGGFLPETVAAGKAAPGVRGVIPVRMSSGESETAVSYTLNLDFSEMADEFQNRLRFYYYTKSGTIYTLHVIDPATATQTSSAILGTLAASGEEGDTKYEYIYWEWMYELDAKWFADSGKWYHKESGATETYEYDGQTELTGQQVFDAIYPDEIPAGGTVNTRTAAKDAFDDFDTDVGLGYCDDEIDCTYAGTARTIEAETDEDTQAVILKAYQVAMKVKLHVTGAQAEPVASNGVSPVNGTAGTAVYRANG